MPRIFPPVLREIPDSHACNGRRTTGLKMMWGEVRIPVQCLILKATGKKSQVPLYADLDASGWAPAILEFLVQHCVRLPFAEAALLTGWFGMQTSSSQLERLFRSYGSTVKQGVNTKLLDAQNKAEMFTSLNEADASAPGWN